MTRKLATLRTISAVNKIEGADAICAYTVDGWQVVDSVGKYKVGDIAVYVEPDAWLPHALAPFLSKGKSPRVYKGVEGEKLRTIKLRGALSQGLLLPLQHCIDVCGCWTDLLASKDVSEWLGIQLWEREIPAQLAGIAIGDFPSFISKTDQERVQNLTDKYDSFKQHEMEVTEKLEGSSLTVYFNNGVFGVCSRNLELKESDDNTFWKAANRYYMRENMTNLGLNIAIQGELVGAGIQGNIYGIADYDFYVYDVFDIDKQKYISAQDRYDVVESLGLKHVPVLGINWHVSLSVNGLLNIAEGKSSLNREQEREGIVLKAFDGSFSFKVISNKYLLAERD